jgi:protein-S-isoprenylcysteine O-methyltransferase Ste14
MPGSPSPSRLPIWLRTLLFTLAFPGTVLAYFPFLLQRFVAGPAFELGLLQHGAWFLLAIGVLGYLLCVISFGREGNGTPAPWDAPRNLVAGGLYRRVRNPMYLSLVIAVAGEALALGSATLAVYGVLVFAVFHLRVVIYEEPVLRAQFGAPFAAYCARVRRWLPVAHVRLMVF